MSVQTFEKYFTLEEAVSMLPEIRDVIASAQCQMNELRDDVILGKRLIMVKRSSGRTLMDEEIAALQEKFERYEETLRQWVEHFGRQGVLLRDLDSGLIDFPYHSTSTRQDFFLCWRIPEDGIFYFHSIDEGFSGRHPITLLPD